MKKFFTILILLSFIGLSSIFAQIPTSGLIAHYPFNGNANDISGHGNNGTNFGAILTYDRFGNPNSAYQFDGVSSYILVPHSPDFQLSYSLTVSLWVRPDAFYLGAYGGNSILSKGDDVEAGNFGWSIILALENFNVLSILQRDLKPPARSTVWSNNQITLGNTYFAMFYL